MLFGFTDGRNLEARREYQRRYNQVKRVTRRKLAKSELHALQARKRQELAGTIPYVCLSLLLNLVFIIYSAFENSICRRGGTEDPERTKAMEREEGAVFDRLHNMKVHFSGDRFYMVAHPTHNSWVEPYVMEVQEMLERELIDARCYLDEPDHPKGSPLWKQDVHARRRLIAIYRQEISLHRQGTHLPEFAREMGESIIHGAW